jgi:hypothetical protein
MAQVAELGVDEVAPFHGGGQLPLGIGTDPVGVGSCLLDDLVCPALSVRQPLVGDELGLRAETLRVDAELGGVLLGRSDLTVYRR